MNMKCYFIICYGKGAELGNVEKTKMNKKMFSKTFQANKDA